MDEKMRENIRKYVKWLPVTGFISSLILFAFFFGVVGVEKEDIWLAVLYCALPFISCSVFAIPLRFAMKKIDY
ncbi:hypothetical protein [Bacillus sp. NPDC077027]|uniref:hypothetical protein n=1 Tax=Bacillus sp. NPDC077027 TaxID=3390548 RepID=UPI003D07FA1C